MGRDAIMVIDAQCDFRMASCEEAVLML